ncbi:MAG: hypothetical protein MRY83_15675 [Flavobacteriales bacterium]|nr:hypothetical protein [Flavobacteriales bacterium]
MTTTAKYCLFLLLFATSIFGVKASENHLLVTGTVYEIPDEMSGCDIVVLKNGVPNLYTKSEENGDFSFKLPLGSDYLIEFSREGYITKIININTKGINRSDIQKNYKFEDINVDLFQEVEDLDVSILTKPIAKIVYDVKTGEFSYDIKYNSEIQKKVEKLWAQVYNERVIRDENYSDEMKIADEKFDEKKYLDARSGYVGALGFRPMAKEPKEKIKLIDDLLGKNKKEEIVDETPVIEEVKIEEEIPVKIQHEMAAMDSFDEQTVQRGNKTIHFQTFVIDNKKTVFKKVDNIYGQQYFFINDQITTSFIWNTQLTQIRN